MCGCQTTQEVKIGQKRFCVNFLSSRHPFPSVCSAKLPSLPLGQPRHLQGGRQHYCRSKDDGMFQNCTCLRKHAILASGAPCLGACWGALSVRKGVGVERIRKETLYSSAIIGPSVFHTRSPGRSPRVKGGWGQSLQLCSTFFPPLKTSRKHSKLAERLQRLGVWGGTGC